ncbi:MAG: LamG domain-containing protein, partial [Synergistaceae bacterium]|nr:LamG domain-containing protein [Synergistaceae bacterium]
MKKKFFLFTMVFLIFVSTIIIYSIRLEKFMGIKTNGSGQAITFTDITGLDLPIQTVSFWIKRSSYITNTTIKYAAGISGWFVLLDGEINGNGSMDIAVLPSGNPGIWSTPAGTIGLNILYHIVIRYDASSLLNNPSVTVNDNFISLTKIQTPTGILTGSKTCVIGGTVRSIVGDTYQYRIYNRLLSDNEISQIYSMRGKDSIYGGLVFCPILYGAGGAQIFDGSNLLSTNLFLDPCSQKYGVPSGSPIGIGETYFMY